MELKADRLNNQQLKTVDSSTMQRRINPREANRMMQRMGMQVKQVDDVTRVIIESASKRIVIDNPEVAKLVASQAEVSVEEATKALQQSGGDLAQAIIILKQKKPS